MNSNYHILDQNAKHGIIFIEHDISDLFNDYESDFLNESFKLENRFIIIHQILNLKIKS